MFINVDAIKLASLDPWRFNMTRQSKTIVFLTASALLAVAALTHPEAASANSSSANNSASAKATSGDCCMPTEICKEPRCISYCSHRFLRCKWDSCHTQKVVLQVPDYCCCCLVEVPVCIPACCEGAPSVCSHCGVFGRQVVEYSWCCGYHLKVVFDRCGNVTVHSYGL